MQTDLVINNAWNWSDLSWVMQLTVSQDLLFFYDHNIGKAMNFH